MPRLLREAADFNIVFEQLAGDERDDERWAHNVVEAADGLVADHLGMAVQWFEHEELKVTREVQITGNGWSPRVRLTQADAALIGGEAMSAIFQPRHPYVSIATVLQREALPGARGLFESYGVGDMAGITSSASPRRIVTLAWVTDRVRPPTSHELRLLSRLSLHLDAGIRLRDTRHVEGIVRPDGGTLEGAASSAALWRALCAGRVTLVPRGRGLTRHFRIVSNPPALRARRALTPRELAVLELSSRGVSGKQQAFLLGVASTTVSRLLASATTKLGLTSPLEAIHLVSGLTGGGALPALDRLSLAERAVMELVQRGLSNQQIADVRQTSVRTVANQVASLLRKTGRDGRRGLIALNGREVHQ